MGAQTLVVGIDALDPDLVDRWRGDLPHLNGLLSAGSSARLASTLPVVTGIAWPSLMTGKNPAKTGATGFEREGRIVDREAIQSRCLWELLDDAGLSVCCIGVPLSYPPDDLSNGVVVSGLRTPDDTDDWVSPPDLAADLPDPVFDTGHASKDVLLDAVETRTEFSLELLERRDWDVFITVFLEIDRAGHSLLEPRTDGGVGGYEDLKEVYRAVDEAYGRIHEQSDARNSFVFSDHGFGRSPTKFVNVNRWLESEGYLQTGDDDPTVSKERVEVLLDKLSLASLLPERVKRFGRRVLPSEETTAEDADPDSRVVYEAKPNGGGFRLLVEDDSLADTVASQARELTDPDTGAPIFDRVVRREDVYEGPYLDRFPDVLVFPGPEYRPRPTRGRSFVEPIPKNSLDVVVHEYHGVYMADGEDVAPTDEWETELDVTELTPLLLHLCDVPVPEDCDGSVRTDLFRPDSDPANRAVSFGPPSREDRTSVGDDADGEVRDRLEELGYL